MGVLFETDDVVVVSTAVINAVDRYRRWLPRVRRTHVLVVFCSRYDFVIHCLEGSVLNWRLK